jgi:hypothetical protein
MSLSEGYLSADLGPAEPPVDDGSVADDHGVASSESGIELAEEAWNCLGIKRVEIAPKGARAPCKYCEKKIPAGAVRFDYRFAVSTNLRDEKRICCNAECVSKLPAGTRSRDIKLVRQWLLDPDLDPIVAASLRQVLEGLTAPLPPT